MANMEKGTEHINLSVLIFGLGANFMHFCANLWRFKLMLRYEVSLALTKTHLKRSPFLGWQLSKVKSALVYVLIFLT